jgi:hypothetical protein
LYFARQLSFKGVTFKFETVGLTPTFINTYDECVQFWVHLLESINLALVDANLVPDLFPRQRRLQFNNRLGIVREKVFLLLN